MAPQTPAPVYEYPALIAEWLQPFRDTGASSGLHLAHHHFPPICRLDRAVCRARPVIPVTSRWAPQFSPAGFI